MYFKMAINNVKKSFKDYTIYFLTLTFAVCIFYSFNSINSQALISEMNSVQRSYIDLMNQIMSILSVGVSVILGSLIIYATNFLIKRRKKEFGIYMILGMRKKYMSIILLLETLFIGMISLVMGLILGLTFVQILSVFTAKLFDVEMSKYAFSISFEAILKTITYFGIMYLLVMMFNMFVVSRYKLIDLLYASRKNENLKIRNSYISTIMLTLSIIILGTAYKNITISELNFYRKEFKIAIIFGIIGTILFFYAVSSLIILILQKNSNIYLNSLNTFTIKQISSKFNTNFLSMSIICLMLLITIGSLSCGLSVKNSMEKSLEECTPVDVSLIYGDDDNKQENIDILGESIKEYGIDTNTINYSVLKVYSTNFKLKNLLYDYADREDNREILDYPIAEQANFIKISDYNNFRKLKNLDEIDLKENEVLISGNYSSMIDIIKNYLDNNDKIKIKDKEFKIKNHKLLEESYFTSPMSMNVFSIIVPNDLISNTEKYNEVLNINITSSNKDEILRDLTEKLATNRMNYNNKSDYYVGGYTREMSYADNKGISSIILFVAVYLGIVFLLASAAVLALQQLSECNDSINRYVALNKMGATKKMINKSIFKQIIIFFTLPLALALFHSYIGIKTVNSYLLALGESNQIYSMIVTALILIIVYGGYLYATYISYKNIINNELK